MARAPYARGLEAAGSFGRRRPLLESLAKSVRAVLLAEGRSHDLARGDQIVLDAFTQDSLA